MQACGSTPNCVFVLQELECRRLLWAPLLDLIQLDDARESTDQYISSIIGTGRVLVFIDTGLSWTGTAPRHQDLANRVWTNPAPGRSIDFNGNGTFEANEIFNNDLHGWDFANHDNNFDPQNTGAASHGTAIAGILAGIRNQNATVTRNVARTTFVEDVGGIAPGAVVIPLRVDPNNAEYELPDDEFDLAGWRAAFAENIQRALLWVEHVHDHENIDIVGVNMSLSIEAEGFAFDVDTNGNDVLDRLRQADVFMAGAAGNVHGTQVSTLPTIDDNVYAVGGVGVFTPPGGTNREAYIPYPTIRQGGVDMYAPARGVIYAGAGASGYRIEDDPDSAATSWATPYITAMSALLDEVDPTLTPVQMRQILRDTGTPIRHWEAADRSIQQIDVGGAFPMLNVEAAIREARDRRDAANQSHPTVSDIVDPPSRTNTALNEVRIVLSEAVTEVSLRNALRVRLNNSAVNRLPAGAEVEREGTTTTYVISALASGTGRHGRYTLEVDPTVLAALDDGAQGAGQLSQATWRMDIRANAPVYEVFRGGKYNFVPNVAVQQRQTKSSKITVGGRAEANGTVVLTFYNLNKRNQKLTRTFTVNADGWWGSTNGTTGSPRVLNEPQFFKPKKTIVVDATVTDDLGNQTAYRNSFRFREVFEPVAPPKQTGLSTRGVGDINLNPALSSADGLGPVRGNNAHTTDKTLMLHGYAEPGHTVTINLDGVGDIGTAHVNATGEWLFDYSATALQPGTYTFNATTRLSADDEGYDAAPYTITIGSVEASAPQITQVVSSDTPGGATQTLYAGMRSSLYGSLRFEGAATPGSLVQLKGPNGRTTTPVTTGADGLWAVDFIPDSLPGIERADDFFAQEVVDSGGTWVPASDESPLFRVVLDPIPPSLDSASAVPVSIGAGAQSIEMRFTEPVSWLRLEDLVLKHDGQVIPWDEQVLETDDGANFTISELAGITASPGEYELSYAPAGALVVNDVAGNGFGVNGFPAFRFLVAKGDATPGQNDTFYLKETGNAGEAGIYINGSPTPAYAFTSSTQQVFIEGLDGNDTLIHELGPDLVPAEGFFFRGGNGTDEIEVRGSSGTDYFEFDEGQVRLGADASKWLDHEQVENVTLLSSAADDQVTIYGGAVIVEGTMPWGVGSVLTVDGGSADLTTNTGNGSTSNLTVNVIGETAQLNVNASQNLYSLTNSGGSIATTGSASITLTGPFSQSAGTTNLSQVSGRDFTMTGGTLTTTKTIVQNGSAAGSFTQSGTSTHSISGDLVVGSSTGTYGATYDLSGGTLNTNRTYVGQSGQGSFNQTGGSHTASTNLVVGYNSGSTGSYTLSGGTLSGGYETIGSVGTATFNQSGGTHTFSGLFMGQSTSNVTYNLTAGSLSSTNGTLELRSGTFNHGQNNTAGTVSVRDLKLGTDAGSATYNLGGSATLTVTNDEYHAVYGDGYGGPSTTAVLNQSGSSTHTVNGTLYMGYASGGYSYGYGYGQSTYNLSGGTLRTGTTWIGYIDQATFNLSGGTHEGLVGGTATTLNLGYGYGYGGILEYSGGALRANVYNYGTINVRGGGTRTIYGNVTNDGYIKTWDTSLVITGTYGGLGYYYSDPADNHFTSLTILPSGALRGGIGDRFFVSGDLISFSTQNQLWQTHDAELHFVGGVSHTLSVNGRDLGNTGEGYVDNFAWGKLVLGSGDSLTLQDAGGDGQAGGALYVNELVLADGVAQLQSINSNGLKVYYNPTAAANAYLAGGTYTLPGGGTLAPSLRPLLADDPAPTAEQILAMLSTVVSWEAPGAPPRLDEEAVKAELLSWKQQRGLFAVAPEIEEALDSNPAIATQP